MKKDIKNIDDIKLLVDLFYEKVKKDDIIGYIFNKHIKTWKEHLPVMYSFWETVLFEKKSYKRNAILKHIDLHKKEPLTQKHFIRWLKLWKSTVDEMFTGTKATEAKNRARMVKEIMLSKILSSGL